MTDFYNYLKEKYGTDSPFSLKEIKFKDYSQIWICKKLQELCASKEICRYEKGWYYIPSLSIFGQSILNPRKILEKKYLGNEANRQGFYSGLSLINQMGLSTQMPNILEIMTNNEETRGRIVKVGNLQVKLKKARTTVSTQNYNVLQLLEVLTVKDKEYFSAEKSDVLKNYIKERGILKTDISKYLAYYPAKTAKCLLETGILYAAQ